MPCFQNLSSVEEQKGLENRTMSSQYRHPRNIIHLVIISLKIHSIVSALNFESLADSQTVEQSSIFVCVITEWNEGKCIAHGVTDYQTASCNIAREAFNAQMFDTSYCMAKSPVPPPHE